MTIRGKDLDARLGRGNDLQRRGVLAWQDGHYLWARCLFFRAARSDPHCAVHAGRFLQEVARTTSCLALRWRAHRQAVRSLRCALPSLACARVYGGLASEYAALAQLSCEPRRRRAYALKELHYACLARLEVRRHGDVRPAPPLPANVTGSLEMPPPLRPQALPERSPGLL